MFSATQHGTKIARRAGRCGD